MHRRSFALFGSLLVLAAAPATAHDPKPHHHDDPYAHDPYAHDHPEPERYDRGRGWSTMLGLGGGYYAPWQGDSGHQAQFELLGVSPSGRFRIGGEFTYREFDTRVFDVKDVEVDAYSVDLLMHFVPNPGGFTPYFGVGLGLQANDFRKRDIQLGNPALDVRDDIGLGFAVLGLLGLELPISPDVALFAEGRLNLAYQITGKNNVGNRVYADWYEEGADKAEVEDLGGGSAMFGVRFRF
jgi:hypothetical protein